MHWHQHRIKSSRKILVPCLINYYCLRSAPSVVSSAADADTSTLLNLLSKLQLEFVIEVGIPARCVWVTFAVAAFAGWCSACWSYCRCFICWPIGVIITSASGRHITLASEAPSSVISALRIGHVRCPSWWKVSAQYTKVAYIMLFM